VIIAGASEPKSTHSGGFSELMISSSACAASLEGLAINSNVALKDAYLGAGGSNGLFNFPNGTHTWGYWGQQLQEMKADLQRVRGATPTST
jgi:S-formylglutathione hydrolase FrmB